MTHQTEYVLDSGSRPDREHLDCLEAAFDPSTIAFLEPIRIQPGWRCLDLGTGNGSISRWLADTVWPHGGVVAADIDTDHILGHAGMRVVRCDVNDALPGGGPYDLIYARALLMHLKRREQIFDDLVDVLAPGGWLVLGEVSDRSQQVLAAPSTADEELVTRVTTTALDLTRAAGVSWDWAHQVDRQMAAAGLTNIAGWEYCRMITGGTVEAQLNGSYFRQVESELYESGLSPDELEQFHTVLQDPRFRAWPWLQMVFTRGQKPITENAGREYVPKFLRDTVAPPLAVGVAQ